MVNVFFLVNFPLFLQMPSKELQVVTVSYPTPVSTRYVSCSLIIQISLCTTAAPK